MTLAEEDIWWNNKNIYLTGACIQKLTDVKLEEVAVQRTASEKTAMVRAARQLLSAITKVLIIADKVVVKQLLQTKDKVV